MNKLTYKEILNSEYFKQTYSLIEEMKKDYPANHGFIHVNHVIDNAKKCVKVFGLNKEEEKLLLIACALHDIGYTAGRENHAFNGSILAREVLEDSDLTKEEVDIICTAIANHGGDKIEEFNNNVSLCLILSDKLDFIESRYRKDIDAERNKAFFNVLSTEPKFDGKTLKIVAKVKGEDTAEKLMERSFYRKIQKCYDLAGQYLNATSEIVFEVVEPTKDK